MKKQTAFICITAILFCSCAKPKATEEDFVNVEVYETGTNMPIAGAQVKLSHCTKYDSEFGCQATGVFASYSTNAEGTAQVKAQDYSKADEGIKIEKSGYWPQPGSQGRNMISAEGWITANIKKVNDYPDDNLFFLFISDENRRVASGMKVAMATLHDTTVTFKAFGAQANHINWLVGREYIVPGWNSFYTVYDTLAAKSLSAVNVVKGSITTIDIEY